MSDDIQWVVLELTAKAEGEDPDIIGASIRHHIRDAEVFIPASVVQRGQVREVHYLVDGYAFIRHRHPDAYYARLEDTKFVQSPLYRVASNRKEKKLATVTNAQIQTLRAQITHEVDQGIEIGDSVTITSGPYKNIKATVREEIPEHDSVVVHIHLRSTDRLVTLPRAFLHLEAKSPCLMYRDRVEAVYAWLQGAKKIARWPRGRDVELRDCLVVLARLDNWVAQGVAIYRWFNAYFAKPDLAPLLASWHNFCALDAMAAKLTKSMHKGATVKHGLNLIVDGTQLFIRCSEAPGLSELTDSSGRPVGGVVGFLRSLGAYRKRFPQGSIYICWDGSSKRRKALFTGYKGQRVSRSDEPSFGLAWLREVLPLLGVHQAFNADEEADDVMASLVHGDLAASANVVITSDRDLLQVVTESTHQLCPACGVGKEKLYDPAAVEAEYGVTPAGMVQLRAISGDASDNIPGALGFGLKTAAKVLRPYGTVRALLKSNLAGLSLRQASNLRASAKQLALNVELMKLCDVPFTEIKPSSNQEGAATMIKSLGIKPDSILRAFFGVGTATESVSTVAM